MFFLNRLINIANKMSTHTPHQINYKHVAPAATPKYKYTKVTMANMTSSSFSITPAGTQEVLFKLPNTVFNLSESIISYQMVTATQGGGICSWMPEDTFELVSSVSLSSAQNADLCNLTNVNRFVKINRKINTKLADYITNDSTSALYPCNSLAGNGAAVPTSNVIGTAIASSANAGGFAALNGANATVVVTGTSSLGANPIAATGTGSTINFTEPRYLTSSALDAALVTSRYFPLSGLHDTIFSINKDLYFGPSSDMILRLNCGPGSGIVSGSISISNPTTTPSANAAAIVVNNLVFIG